MTKRRTTVNDIYSSSNLPQWIDKNTFKKIWEVFADTLVKELILKGNAYKLPARMGTLQIRKKKGNKKSVDFYNTKKYGKTIYLTNNHSEGYYAFLHWDTKRPHCQMEYKSIYSLKFTRDNKRFLARQIKENNTIVKYFEAL